MSAQGGDALGKPYQLKLHAKAEGALHSSEFQEWVTERYRLFLMKDGVGIRGDVYHEPWKVRSVRIESLEGGFSIQRFMVPKDQLASSFLADPMFVRFAPFVKCNEV